MAWDSGISGLPGAGGAHPGTGYDRGARPPPPADKEPALQAAALGDGRSPERGAGHRDHGGHSPRDGQLRQEEVSPGAGSGGFQPQCQAGDGLLRLGPSALCPPSPPLPWPIPARRVCLGPHPTHSAGRGRCWGHTRSRAEQGWAWGRGVGSGHPEWPEALGGSQRACLCVPSFFGRAFEKAAEGTNSRALHNHFDLSGERPCTAPARRPGPLPAALLPWACAAAQPHGPA